MSDLESEATANENRTLKSQLDKQKLGYQKPKKRRHLSNSVNGYIIHYRRQLTLYKHLIYHLY